MGQFSSGPLSEPARTADVLRVGLVVYGRLDVVSGGNLYDRQLVDHLRRRGDRVEIVSLAPSGHVRHMLQNLSPSLKSRLQHAEFDVLLLDELVHPSLFWLNGSRGGRVAYPRLGVVHHLTGSEPGPVWRRLWHLALERRFLGSLDGFVFNSKETRDSVWRLGEARRPHVVAPPGGDRLRPTMTGAAIRERARRNGPLRLVFVGNLIPRKGLDVLVSALARLGEGEWRLEVIGSEARDARYAGRVRQLVTSHGLQDRVRFLGSVEDKTLTDRLRESHVLVGPSSYEGFGIVYLEGMGFGLPAVACPLGGAAEVVRHERNGVLVPPGDSRALADQLGRLVRDRALVARLGQNALADYGARPTWEASMSMVRQFLTRVARCAPVGGERHE